MRSVPAIAFDYRSSRVIAIAIAFGALLALTAIAACGLPLPLKFILAVAAVAYPAFALRRFLRPSFDHAVWHSAGHWRLRHAQADAVTCELIDATMRGPLIVLRLQLAPRRSIALVLLPDNCNAETRRRLRVRLARGIAPAHAS